MSDKKISGLTAKSTNLTSHDLVEVSEYVSPGVYSSKKMTGSQIFDYCNPSNTISAKVTLTATQIKALSTTPIEIISATGTGTAVDVLSIALRFNYGTTVFNHGTSDYKLAVYPTTESVTFVSAPILNATTSTFTNMYRNEITNNADIQLVENDDIVIACNNTVSDATTGDSTIDVYINYRIITL
jgi:hypothetical protein